MKLPSGWRHRTADVLEMFCAEAAVLLLVFPLLDEFVQHGRQGISWKLISASLSGSLAFLLAAMLIAIFIKKENH